MLKKVIIATSLFVFLNGCASIPTPKNYKKFCDANPLSILIVPVVNRSVNVDAPDYFLSTLPIPVAERGYYVFPVNLVKRMLEDEGLSDANLVHTAEPSRLCDLFGADAVLYVTIERWDAKYLVLATQVTVEFDYVMKDGRTNDIIWQDHKQMVYTPQNSSSGNPLADLIVMAVSAAITKAAPNYMPLSRQANGEVFKYPGPGFPAGPYRGSEYRKDIPTAQLK